MSEPMVKFEIEMTPEEYVAIKRNADWQGWTIAKYLVQHALGRTPKGC